MKRPSARRFDETGSFVAELVIVTPLLVIAALIAAFFGRYENTKADIVAAARAGAAAASVEYNASSATDAADAAVNDALSANDNAAACPNPKVTVDTSQFFSGGQVTVTVQCVSHFEQIVSSSQWASFLSPSVTLTGSVTDPVDFYRQTAAFSGSARKATSA